MSQTAASDDNNHLAILHHALAYVRAGRSVLPVPKGKKHPTNRSIGLPHDANPGWKRFRDTPATPDELHHWFRSGQHLGLCILAGQTSGTVIQGTMHGLEFLDIDDHKAVDAFFEAANWHGLSSLLARLPVERTPKGGAHLGWLCTTREGNLKLAQRKAGEKVTTLIETRGEGGLCVVAPTPPGVHPDRPEHGYEMVRGSWAEVPIISPQERQALLDVARSMNEYVDERNVNGSKSSHSKPGDSDRPGDDLNARADRKWWRALLEKHDWRLMHTRGDVEYWQRPGKEGRGTSATLGACGPYFYVFSSNASPLQPETAYAPFGAYVALEHKGDFVAAAKALAKQGYGNASPVLPLSDYTNARTLVHFYGTDLRYCHPWKRWLTYKEKRWQLDDTGGAMRFAKATMIQLAKRASTPITDMETASTVERPAMETATKHAIAKSEQLLKHVKTSLRSTRLNAILSLAESELPVLPADLDIDPWLLNCANGTLDLRTGKFRQHRREDMLTKLVPVDYDPYATCPIWEAFLWRIMGCPKDDARGDEKELAKRREQARELIRFLQKAVGYCLTGDTREQCMFLLHGTGANGKSTFLEAVREMLGDYAKQADFTTFLWRRSDGGPRNDIADLRGARFVSAIEVDEGKRLAEALVKQLTGGDTIKARFLFQEYFEFMPTFKVFLAANHMPVIRSTDHGMWRRIRLIPFTVTIPEDERDKTLSAKLRGELPGILNWAIEGCLAWQAEGLEPPDEVAHATATYRHEMDVIGQFIAECCIENPALKVQAKPLYEAYKQWCEQNGETQFAQRTFGMRLNEKCYVRYSCNGRIWRRGLGLRDNGSSNGSDGDGSGEAPPNSPVRGDDQQDDQTLNQQVDESKKEATTDLLLQPAENTDFIKEGDKEVDQGRRKIQKLPQDLPGQGNFLDLSSTSSTSSTSPDKPPGDHGQPALENCPACHQAATLVNDADGLVCFGCMWRPNEKIITRSGQTQETDEPVPPRQRDPPPAFTTLRAGVLWCASCGVATPTRPDGSALCCMTCGEMIGRVKGEEI